MWADEAGLDSAERLVDGWERSFEERAARARALNQRLTGLTGTASSDDKLVTVTVDSAGGLLDLRLDEKTRGQSAAATARQVVTVARAARADLARQVEKATVDVLGADDPAGRAVVDSYRTRLQAQGGVDGGR